MGKASFKVDCPEAGIRREVEMPLPTNGFVRLLIEDLERAFELYEHRTEAYRKAQAEKLPDTTPRAGDICVSCGESAPHMECSEIIRERRKALMGDAEKERKP